MITILEEKGIKVHVSYVGNYFTSLEMAGATLTLMKLDEDKKEITFSGYVMATDWDDEDNVTALEIIADDDDYCGGALGSNPKMPQLNT